MQLTLSLPKATIGDHGTVPEATIVTQIPWLPLASIGAVFTQYMWDCSTGSQKSGSEKVTDCKQVQEGPAVVSIAPDDPFPRTRMHCDCNAW